MEINEGRIHSEKSAESGIKNRGPDQTVGMEVSFLHKLSVFSEYVNESFSSVLR